MEAGQGYFVLTLTGGDYWHDWIHANATAPKVQAALKTCTSTPTNRSAPATCR